MYVAGSSLCLGLLFALWFYIVNTSGPGCGFWEFSHRRGPWAPYNTIHAENAETAENTDTETQRTRRAGVGGLISD